jgi:hypothetical protein
MTSRFHDGLSAEEWVITDLAERLLLAQSGDGLQAKSMFYVLRSPDAPWGDYGDILTHGMSAHLSRAGGRIQLERTGPFMPPITFPGIGDVVVTDQVRKLVEAQRFTGVSFRPVVKARIVRVDWHLWDRTAEEPETYPSSGEPEDYILRGRHSAEASRAIGRLWEMVGMGVPGLQLKEGYLDPDKHPGADLCADAPSPGYLFASQRLRDWLAEDLGEWVRFEPAKVREARG